MMLEEQQFTSPNIVSKTPTSTPGAVNSATRRLTQEGLKYEKIKKCTVIMPKLQLNVTEMKPWCMFHNTHECPCAAYKHPLDYHPDLNASRNVARRTLGKTFKTKFNLNREEQEVLAVKQEPEEEMDISEFQMEMCPRFNHDPIVHSARTHGHVIKSTLRKATKYPHTVVLVKPVGAAPKPGPIMPPANTKFGTKALQPILPKLAPGETLPPPPWAKRSPKKPRKAKNAPEGDNVINPKPVTLQIDDVKDFKLQHRAKGSFMFVHWRIINNLLKSKKIQVWSTLKPRRTLMMTWTGQTVNIII